MTGFRRMKVRAQELSIVAITWNQTTTRGMWRQTDLVEMAFGFRLHRKISHHLIILLPIALPLALHDVMCRCTEHAYIFLSFSFPLYRLRRALLLLLLHNPSKWEKVAEPVSFLFSPFIRRPLGLVSWSECVLCVRFFYCLSRSSNSQQRRCFASFFRVMLPCETVRSLHTGTHVLRIEP